MTPGEDCTIRVWNAEDGKPIRMMLAKVRCLPQLLK